MVDQIMPILRAAIGRGVVRPVPPEDKEELVQDCAAMAAKLVDAAERNGKTFTPGNIAFYTLQSAVGGRRAFNARGRDVLSPIARVSKSVAVSSVDAPVQAGESDGDTTLHDVLASTGEGPDVAAGRDLDWDALAEHLQPRKTVIIDRVARDVPGKEIAAELGVSQARVVQLKREIGSEIRDEWGQDCLAECQRPPAWWWHQQVAREQRACRYERVSR